MATWALGQLESRSAVPALAGRLQHDTEQEVRVRAAWALGQIEDHSSIEPLAAALRDDRNAEVRSTAAWALGQINDRSAVTALVAALKDSSALVRETAAWAVGQIGAEQAPSGLVDALKDRSAEVRKNAAWALGQISDASSVAALREAMRDPDHDVVRTALWALSQMDDDAARAAFVEILKSNDPELAGIRRPYPGRESRQSVAVTRTPSGATPVPMSATRHLALLTATLLTASSLGAQRPRLPFGLRAGRRDVGIRAVTVDHHVATAWHPAACARRPAAPANPCRDAAPDSGLLPLLVLESSGIAALDTARSIYFASHGYVVVLGPVADARSAARGAAVCRYRAGCLGWGRGGVSIRRAWHRRSDLGGRTAWNGRAANVRSHPARCFEPFPACDRCDARVSRRGPEPGSLTVPDLMLRLHRAGLDVCCSPTH